MFDEEPDDPHGQCAAEIHRLEADLSKASQERDALRAKVERLWPVVLAVSEMAGPRAHYLGCRCEGRDRPGGTTCLELMQMTDAARMLVGEEK